MARPISNKRAKARSESLDENRARSRRDVETESADNPLIETLLRGSDEDRARVLDELNNLAPEHKATVREILKATIAQDRKRQPPVYIGWLISALALVADKDTAAIDIVAQQLVDRDSNDWARYWALAQLYWTRGLKEAASHAHKAGSSSDPSPLVRSLADAIIQRDKGREIDLKIKPGDQIAFAQLRALQVVGGPTQVPSLVHSLLERPGGDWVYEILLAMTATPETTKQAAQYLATVGRPVDVVEIMSTGTTGATPRVLQRFVRLLERFARPDLERAIATANQSQGHFTSIARGFLTSAPGDLPQPGGERTTLPPGTWRAELAYRSVLQRPATFDLLESLSAAQLFSVLEQAGLTTADTPPHKLEDLARSIAPGGPANPLWLAWIKNVHPARLTQD